MYTLLCWSKFLWMGVGLEPTTPELSSHLKKLQFRLIANPNYIRALPAELFHPYLTMN